MAKSKSALRRTPSGSASPKAGELAGRKPVNGAWLLDEITEAIRKYVILDDGAAEVVAMWAVHTHAIDAFQITPRLGITSVVKGCGKSTLLDVLNVLVRSPLLAANISAAALYRQVDKTSPTVLIDEADTFLVRNEGLRGILNAGHRRGVFVYRGDDKFSAWAATAIALIGRLPPTLEDRSILVRLKRRRADEPSTAFRADRTADLMPLAQRAADWAGEHLDVLTNADPVVPSGLQNREADNWRPLFAIADIAGGHWPDRARKIATDLSNARHGNDPEPGVMLLQDIFRLQPKFSKRLPSAQLASALAELEDRPWSEWRGKPITAKAISGLLAPFGIRPNEMRQGSRVLRGYEIGQFEDAFARYVEAPKTLTRPTATAPLAAGWDASSGVAL